MPRGIYLDGNSLGLLSYAAQAAIERRLKQWQYKAVAAWDEWLMLAERLSPAVAKLVGAQAAELIITGSISSNLHAMLATFYQPDSSRKNLLATSLDFPSDIYVLQSWAKRYNADLKFIPSRDSYILEVEDILAALTEDIAIAVLPTVLYRSGQLLDVSRITQAARERGIIIGWDAAHSIGTVPHAFHDDGVDFAVWCSYKYLNAGPGAPGGLFVHERHFDALPGLPGWWGNSRGSQFEMRHDFEPAEGAAAYQQGTPSILALAGLEGALAIFEECSIDAIRTRSLELTQYLMDLVDEHLPEMTIRTPREASQRGGHVALEHPEALQLSQALRQRQIITDYRPNDVIRLAPVALYNTKDELGQTVQQLRELLDSGSHRHLVLASTVT